MKQVSGLDQAVLAPAHAGQTTYTGNPAGHGMRAVELAGGSVVVGLGQAPHGVETGVGLGFGDSALPNSPAGDHLLGAGGWGSWGSISDQRADVPPGRQHNPARSNAGYGTAMAEPAGWAVVAAALLTLLGLLGLRRRER